MSIVTLQKKYRDVLKNIRGLFSAAQMEETLSVGYNISRELVNMTDPSLGDIIETLINDCISEPGFYEEILYARVAHPLYNSRYPALHDHLLSMITKSFKLSLDPKSPYYRIAEDENRTLGTEFIQLIRNQTILRKWQKYRKAYVFDNELALALTDMSDGVEVPVELPLNMPFETVYFEFPKDSELSKFYIGAFVDVNRSSGLVHIMEENVRVIEKLSEDVNRHPYMKNLSDNTKDWVKDQVVRNKRDMDLTEGNEYISLHLLLVAKQKEANGFNEIYTYIMPLSADKDGICHAKKENIRTKVYDDDFMEKDNLVELIMFVLNGLMYISSNNADIEERKIKGVTKLVQMNKKNRRKKYEVVDNSVSLNRCGFMYGTTVRAYREKQEREDKEYEAVNGRKPVRPHPVRGHYERYHVGKGRTQVIWKLKLPHFNRGTSGEKPVVHVSKVRG